MKRHLYWCGEEGLLGKMGGFDALQGKRVEGIDYAQILTGRSVLINVDEHRLYVRPVSIDVDGFR